MVLAREAHYEVLIVDDDPLVARAMSWLLAGSDEFETRMANSAEAALESLQRQGEVDVVVADVEMPGGMNGLELLNRVRSQWPDSEVLVVSGHDRTRDALQATRDGAFDYMAKPWDPAHFVETVRRAAEHARLRRGSLEGRAHRSPLLESRAPAMRNALRRLVRVAELDFDVLLTGPTGVGKSALARLLHGRSARRDGPFVTVDCGAMASQLVESELFGHVRGAFTGATEDRMGLIQMANGGTLFLDEVGNMSPELQSRLLRVVQERVVRPVGGRHEIPLDVRVVSATCVDLEAAVADGTFREDLFHRLNDFGIALPTLLERREDLPQLVQYFLRRHTEEAGRPIEGVDRDALDALLSYEWPGNLRELSHVLREAVALELGSTLGLDSLRKSVRDAWRGPLRVPCAAGGPAIDVSRSFREAIEPAEHTLRAGYLRKVLALCDHNIAAAARHAGLDRSNFRRLLKKHGVALG